MVSYTQEITLDLNANSAYTTIAAKQGDDSSRFILVHLTKDNIEYHADPNNQAYFRCRKPDGHSVIDPAVINADGTITVELTAQALAAAGRAYADVVEYSTSDSVTVSTASFILIIMSAPNVAGDAISSNEFGYLQRVVNDANTIINEAEAWAVGNRAGTPVTEDDPQYENNAKYYSEVAQDAKEKIEGLGVSSVTLSTGQSATVEKTFDSAGTLYIKFGLPAGPTGATGLRGASTVHVGSTEPSDPDINVWINPEEDIAPVLVTANQVVYYDDVTYNSGTIGKEVKFLATGIVDAITAAENASAAARAAASAAENVGAIASRVTVIEDELPTKITNPQLLTSPGFLKAEQGENEDEITISWAGTVSYADEITDKPKINNIDILSGNYDLETLGIAPATGGTYYTKPSDGIPNNDLNTEVQSNLSKAESAIQNIKLNGSIIAKESGLVDLGTFLTSNNIVNKNYLDNPWFTVNQRGTTSYPNVETGTYIYDRWKVILAELSNRSITANRSSLFISAATEQRDDKSFIVGQIIDNDTWRALSGKTVCASISFSWDNITFTNFNRYFTCPIYGAPDSADNLNKWQFNEAYGWGMQVFIQNGHLVFQFFWKGNNWGTSVNDHLIYIDKVKLELGMFSTLDTESEPVYNEELRQCQKYFRRYGGTVSNSEDNVDVILGNGIARDGVTLDIMFTSINGMVDAPSVTIPSGINLSFKRGLINSNTTNQPIVVDSDALNLYAIPSIALTSTTFTNDVYYTKSSDNVYVKASAWDSATASSKLYYRKTFRKDACNNWTAVMDRYGTVAFASFENYYIVLPRTIAVTQGEETVSYVNFSAEP